MNANGWVRCKPYIGPIPLEDKEAMSNLLNYNSPQQKKKVKGKRFLGNRVWGNRKKGKKKKRELRLGDWVFF